MLECEQLSCHEILCGTFKLMYVSCFIVAFYLVWCVGYVRINITLSFLIYSQNYPILYYFIVLMVGCGTYTLIHIDRLDIRQIREVEHGNFIGIYLRLRKCNTPMYKLILSYAHMYATCSSREGGMPHITLLYYFTLEYSMVLEFLHGIN